MATVWNEAEIQRYIDDLEEEILWRYEVDTDIYNKLRDLEMRGFNPSVT